MFDKKWHIKLVSIFSIALVLGGCAGRAANVVMTNQYGDETKSCKALESEMQFTQEEISRLIPQTNKTGENVVLGITGWLFIVPWFFMDLSKAEQEEINGLRQRYNHLAVIAADRNCAEQRERIPDFKDRKAFEAYQKRQQGKLGAVPSQPTDTTKTQEPTPEEARAKVRELEAKSSNL